MILVERMICVNRSVSDVFAYISNHENYALWFPGTLAVHSEDKLPHGSIGKAYLESVRMPTGRIGKMKTLVIESDQGTRFVTEADFALLQPRMEVYFKSLAKNKTELRWVFLSRNRSTLGRFFVKLIGKPTLEKRSRAGLARLKLLLEA